MTHFAGVRHQTKGEHAGSTTWGEETTNPEVKRGDDRIHFQFSTLAQAKDG